MVTLNNKVVNWSSGGAFVRGQCGGFFPRAKTGLFLAFFGHVTYAHALRPHIDPIYWVLGVCGLYHVRAYSWSGDGHVLSRATPGISSLAHVLRTRDTETVRAWAEYRTAGYGISHSGIWKREWWWGVWGERDNNFVLWPGQPTHCTPFGHQNRESVIERVRYRVFIM